MIFLNNQNCNIEGYSVIRIIQKGVRILKRDGFVNFTKLFGKYLIQIACIPILLIRLKNFKVNNLIDLVRFSFNVGYGIIRSSQCPSEILKLLIFLNNLKPKYILEIGNASGGTLFLFSRIASQDATIITIDLPGGAFGGGYPIWKIPILKSFALPQQRIYLIRGDSHRDKTLRKVKSILGDRKLDFLFIDGDHTYEGVRMDFEMYSNLVRKGGIIAFHDIVPGAAENVGGVPEFYKEIKLKYKDIEFVKSWNQKTDGIGIIKYA